jgi:hypothetical protein
VTFRIPGARGRKDMNDQAEGRYHDGCLIPSASRGWPARRRATASQITTRIMHTAGRLFSRDCGKEILFWKLREEGGPGFAGGRLFPYKSIGMYEKNFQKFWKIRNLSGREAATVQRAASFAMRQTRNSPKALAPNLATGQAPVWTANS